MTLEINIDAHNNMLIAFVTGEFEFEKIVKVISIALDKCIENGLNRTLIDMAQVVNPDIPTLQKYVYGNELLSLWGKSLKMCIVYDHKYIPEIGDEAREGPGKWALLTSNQNQSVLWLLAN